MVSQAHAPAAPLFLRPCIESHYHLMFYRSIVKSALWFHIGLQQLNYSNYTFYADRQRCFCNPLLTYR